MTITIPDRHLEDTNTSERELLIEVACRLFAAEKLFMPHAARLAALTRSEFEDELVKRDLPLVIYSEQMLNQDLRAVKQMEEARVAGRQ